jgi:hypothetical protein
MLGAHARLDTATSKLIIQTERKSAAVHPMLAA